jgi:WhiB family redox-sensing transcriptional regulator
MVAVGLEPLMQPGPFAEHRPAWHDQAACRGQGPSAWFPTRGEDLGPARAISRACPVRVPCLQAALDLPPRDDHGIWGGTSVKQRRRARRHSLTAEGGLAELDAVA